MDKSTRQIWVNQSHTCIWFSHNSEILPFWENCKCLFSQENRLAFNPCICLQCPRPAPKLFGLGGSCINIYGKCLGLLWHQFQHKLCCICYLSPVKRICVFEHSVMTNFNCACPAIQRGQGSGFLSEGSS